MQKNGTRYSRGLRFFVWFQCMICESVALNSYFVSGLKMAPTEWVHFQLTGHLSKASSSIDHKLAVYMID
ncbi:hypothetical protein D7M11_25705 [Paenibacillus ginsengarvi]|uniref:Uncharacterized protein n=1 Tax=Paenibacillus ginsengarvi TaxID=400777 RepID=A0A3B0BRL0_9BACL|nr:hypothetical protein D7M11_25705 [Paenibacillus ginsengarvi]